MAWIDKTAGAAGTTGDNYRLVSEEASIATIREEFIKTGYNLTETIEDEETGEERTTITFHQTGMICIKCRVVETVKVEEWNAINEAKATSLAGSGLDTAISGVTLSDNRTGYRFTQSGAYIDIPNCDGTVVKVSARRANEANGWTVTKTTITSKGIGGTKLSV